MGWLIGFDSRGELLRRLTRPESRGLHSTRAIRCRMVGYRHFWVVWEHIERSVEPDEAATVNRYVVLYLITRTADGWGYKPIDESSGPSELDCPLSYLDGLTAPQNWGVEWRQRVREYHRRRGTGHRFQVGDIVPLTGAAIPHVELTQVGRRLYGRYEGRIYRVARRFIALPQA